MGDILSTISNFLSASWRAGAALFLVGASVYLSELYDIPPLSELDREWYQGSILLGVVGLAFFIVHGGVLLGRGIGFVAPRLWRVIQKPRKVRKERELSLRNFETISEDDLVKLLLFKSRGTKRFKAPFMNEDLNNLYNDGFLEKDSEGQRFISEYRYWIIPDHIWSRLDDPKYEDNIKEIRSWESRHHR